MRKFTTLSLSTLVLGAAVLLVSCEEQTGTHENAPAIDSRGISSSGTLSLQGEIISVPSPTQISVMIQKANIPFDQTLMNPLTNRDQYLTEYDKAIGLGVFGADLAYAANYEAGQLNNDYFNAVGKLSADLQIIDHIDQKLVTSLNNHIANRDSLLRLNAQFFKAGDNYLKESRRTDLAGLILFGGWAEALYISVKVGKTNEEIRNRIGEQKYASVSMRNLVNKIGDPSLAEVRSKLDEVVKIFESLRTTYTYQKPINDSKEKITYLRGKTTVEMTPEQFTSLEVAVEQLRNLIIQ